MLLRLTGHRYRGNDPEPKRHRRVVCSGPQSVSQIPLRPQISAFAQGPRWNYAPTADVDGPEGSGSAVDY